MEIKCSVTLTTLQVTFKDNEWHTAQNNQAQKKQGTVGEKQQKQETAEVDPQGLQMLELLDTVIEMYAGHV